LPKRVMCRSGGPAEPVSAIHARQALSMALFATLRNLSILPQKEPP
jgi:hypothetical protein